MIMATFPSDIIGRPRLRADVRTLHNPVITSETEAGQPVVRQIFEDIPEIRQADLYIKSDQHMALFDYFVANEAKYGASFFDMELDDPVGTSTQRVRFNGTPRKSKDAPTGQWVVSFSLWIQSQNLMSKTDYDNIVHPAQPSFTRFTVDGWTNRFAANTNAGGMRTVRYAMTNPGEVSGSVTLTVNGRAIATNLPAAATHDGTYDFGTITLAEGQSATASLSAVSNSGRRITSPVAVASVPVPPELVYWGTKATNTFVAADATSSDFQNAQFRSGTQAFTFGPWTANEQRYWIYAQRANRPDPTAIMAPSLGFLGNLIGTFIKGASNVTIDGNQYEFWASRFAYNNSAYPQGIEIRFTR